MRKLLAAGAVCALTLAFAAGAGARANHPTHIQILGSDTGTRHLVLFGDLDTVKKCRGDRLVKVLVKRATSTKQAGKGGGFELADTDRSSDGGAWAFEYDTTDVIESKVKVTSANAGNDNLGADTVPVV